MALQYLETELATDQKPEVREALEQKYNSLLHDELVEQIATHRERYIQRFGHDIRELRELGGLPEDPLGAGWVLAPDGRIRSALREELLAHRAVVDERAMVLLPPMRRPD